MTTEQAIKYLTEWKNAIIDRGDTLNSQAVQALIMAIKALEQEPSRATDKWIPVKWHKITDEERERDKE